MKAILLLFFTFLLPHKSFSQLVGGLYRSNELSFVSNSDHSKDYREADKTYFMAIQLDSLDGGEIVITLPQYEETISYSIEEHNGQINEKGVSAIIFDGIANYGEQTEKVQIIIYETDSIKLMFSHEEFSLVFHNLQEVSL